MNNENKKSLSNFNQDAVEGKNVMGGGFGDGFVDDGSGNGPSDPFQAPGFNAPDDPIGGGIGFEGGNPPVGDGNPPLPFGDGPLDPMHGGPLGHGPH